MKQAAIVESNKRLRTSGFKRTPVGYTFPGTDNNEVMEAKKEKEL